MWVLLIIVLFALGALYVLSMGKYSDYVSPLDKNTYPLKHFLPIGLYLLDLVKLRYTSQYDRRITAMMIEIYGTRYSAYYVRVHWGNKLVFLFLAVVLILTIGAASRPDGSLAVFGAAVIAGMLYLPDRDLNERLKKRRREIQIDFPDFINRLTLLINAGLTVPRAWEKISADTRRDRPLYREIEKVVADIRAGKPEIKAYEDFAKRCRSREVTRVISIIIQNMKKGNSELVSILRVMANECWESRKNIARKLGEEASTKMVFPLMLMFGAILIIAATPAVLALQGV